MKRILNELQTLERKMKERFGDLVWLFPKVESVKGYYGTGLCERYGKKVMFVAERPSRPSRGKLYRGGKSKQAIEMFYKALKRLNLENAHLTDFIKTRARAGEWSYKDIKENLAIFEEEFNVINPDVIITLGQNSFSWLSLYLIMKKSSLEPYKLKHYSQYRDVESYKDEFFKNLKEITKTFSIG